MVQLYDLLPEVERLIVDVLRGLVRATLPKSCREKLSWSVPYFSGKRGICIIWPSTIPGGGIKSGVLLGFWYGNQLPDPDNYLTRGTNTQVFYKILQSVDDIDVQPIINLLKEAAILDQKGSVSSSSRKKSQSRK